MASGSKDEFFESDRGGIGEYCLREKKGKVPHVKSVNTQYSVQAGQQVVFIHTREQNTVIAC